MHVRLVSIGLIALLEIFMLLGVAVSETSSPDFDAYVVGQNETLASIAANYGISADYLAEFNKLQVTDSLKTGQVIVVPRVTQLPSSVSANATAASAPTPSGAQVQGVLATVTAAKIDIWSKPAGGVLLYDHATQGTDLLVTGESGVHYSVLMADGSTGWVRKAGVTLSENHVTVDKPTPPPQPTPDPGGRREFRPPANGLRIPGHPL